MVDDAMSRSIREQITGHAAPPSAASGECGYRPISWLDVKCHLPKAHDFDHSYSVQEVVDATKPYAPAEPQGADITARTRRTVKSLLLNAREAVQGGDCSAADRILSEAQKMTHAFTAEPEGARAAPPNQDELIELVRSAMPLPDHLADNMHRDGERAIRFTWRGYTYRVTGREYPPCWIMSERVGDGMLTGDNSSILLQNLLHRAWFASQAPARCGKVVQPFRANCMLPVAHDGPCSVAEVPAQEGE